MSNMRDHNGGDPTWTPLADAITSGVVVKLVEDLLDGEDDVPLHRTTAPATEAVLVLRDGRPLPGLLLADGHVLCLSWEQVTALQRAFFEFQRLVEPTLMDKYGPARACVALPQ